jgi:hypothetical protein
MKYLICTYEIFEIELEMRERRGLRERHREGDGEGMKSRLSAM